MKEIYVYDLETYPNFFLAVFKHITTKEITQFEISDRFNQLDELRKFLKTPGLKLIGFNNLNFDYPVLHNSILSNNNIWTAEQIYIEVTKIINNKYSSIWSNQIKIPQLDLYKIWHYDNKNKSTSLKWLEFAMRLPNVEDLPYKPGTILTFEQMQHVCDYCVNDIEATEKFFYKSLKHIELRQFYTNHEGLDLINASEIKMSKEIFGKYLSKEMNISTKDVQSLRTYRDQVAINDILFNYLEFNDPINQQSLNIFKNHIWRNDNPEGISFRTSYKNVIREYAEGGLHSFGKTGVYQSDDEYMLVDVDFASFYPHISFRNKLHPEHIPEKVFSEIYEGFYTERKNYPKSDPRNYVLKIILNGSYGLSKDEYSFLYDPKWQLAICINGQLILTLLTERVFEKLQKDITIIFENTDGAMYRIHRSDYDLLQEACKEVEKIVNIPLEIQICEKIIAKDVNNYINVIKDDYIKFKGVFEIDRDYHKNHSKRIISIALANYFIYNISVEETIYNHLTNTDYSFCDNYGIYDFCLGAKMKGDNLLYRRFIKDFEVVDEEISKMTRYYVSNDGFELIKKLPPLEKNKLTDTDKYKLTFDSNQLNIFDIIEDIQIDPKDRESNIEASWKCTIFNKFESKPEIEYNINYEYYINECNKIIKIFK